MRDFILIIHFTGGPDYISTKRELLLIDSSLDIERPSYTGARLDAENVSAFQKVI